MNQLITVTASGCLVLAAALDRGLRGVGGGGGGEGGGGSRHICDNVTM